MCKRNGLHDFLVAADDDHDDDDADKNAEDDDNNDDAITPKSLSMIMQVVVMVIFNQILMESILGVSVVGPKDRRRSDRYCRP